MTRHSRPLRAPPEPRELLTLRCPRELDARCDEPLEYPEKASELLRRCALWLLALAVFSP
jgi:hypothetical protein